MPPTIQLKRGTSAALLGANPFPLVGEIIFEQDTGLFKIGDGIRAWNNLPYANPQSTLTVSIGNIIGLQEALDSKSDVAHTHSISNVIGLQAALDTKAPIASPTFTGTVSGITKGMVGLGNVPNVDATERANHTGTQAISTVSGLQTALDGKAASTHNHSAADITSGTLSASRLPANVVQTSPFGAFQYIAAGVNAISLEHGPLEVGQNVGDLALLNLSYDAGGVFTVLADGTVSVTNRVVTPAVNFSGDASVQTTAWTGNVGWSNVTGKPATFAPATHKSSHASGGSDALTPSDIGAAVALHSHGFIDPFGGVTPAVAAPETVSAPIVCVSPGGLISRGEFGTQAGTICQGNDSRLSNSRTPTDGSVTTAKLANGSVTAEKIASGQSVSFADITVAGPVTLTGISGILSATSISAPTGIITCSTIRVIGVNGVDVAGGGGIAVKANQLSAAVFNVSAEGVVTAGTWQGTAIAVAYGGTGATTTAAARTNLGAAPLNSPVLALGTLTGSNAINFSADSLVQTLTLNGTAVTFTKGTGWPSTNVIADVILRVTVTSATSITWTIVTDWFAQPTAGALSVGTHIFLLRAVGASIIEGHYIGSKTN